ncbi:hypothetical protein HGP14_15805 [Rhizobium sp. P32RR-XVIII]|uniref:hypothetical protein n=1 Tax=Rhizobium sp. P32RR-XVIII TaxID=2726738 RepID=UPI0014576DEC|nr:hypothetical protein [Rhizobium sp. P32RR-XVIII]NLS04821.1 hypothetical protein [Rhizobium sp. P32RR-XVIII]
MLQSTGLSSVAMLGAYAYGKANYTPPGSECPPISNLRFFDASRCTDAAAVTVYPEPWLAILVRGVAVTLILGGLAATFDRSVLARYLLAGWLAFCAVIAVSGYFSYSGMGRFPGAYFVAYPATTVVAFGVAAACVAAIANIALRIRFAGPAIGRRG